MEWRVEEKEALSCCGSTEFAKEMEKASPFTSLPHAISAARDIWFNRVGVKGWLEAFEAHPQIGDSKPLSHSPSPSSAQWSKGEQSTALATATSSILQELSDWNARYRNKFGFIFLICASGRSSADILSELKARYHNRPIVEFEIAAKEQMKVTELRLEKLFSARKEAALTGNQHPTVSVKKVEEDRVSITGGHFIAAPDSPFQKTSQVPSRNRNLEDRVSITGGRFIAAPDLPFQKTSQVPSRNRPPITTHVLDVSQGSPAAGVEVHLEMWKGVEPHPSFNSKDASSWVLIGSSVTDANGRSGKLMNIVDIVDPGIYRISFNTGKYCHSGFFPYVSVVFKINDHQTKEHFHVPLLLSPFSFTTYRGS